MKTALFEVYFFEDAMSEAVRHFEDKSKEGMEAMGFFLGRVYSWKGEPFVIASEYVTGENDATRISVRFAESAFSGIARKLNEGGKHITIWAHSHPGFGCFMSSTDLNTHERYFDDANNYALVVDPLRKEKKLFKLVAGDCVEASFAVVRKKHG